MKWFNKHPRQTIFYSWIIAVGLSYITQIVEEGLFWPLYAIAILQLLVVLFWSLKVRNRSLFNMFYLLIPLIGFLILWGMDNKSSN